ncbi:hypothetical protein ASL20_20880 [Cupriavidus necator]|nr:hypothetical protein C265_03388 [Cupriavidus sp. GA3-3]KUE86943.1 hypothetical protein ASL20_20880 [Cupriavidus necator]
MAPEQAEQAAPQAELREIIVRRRGQLARSEFAFVAVPATASTRMRSPSRTRASAPPASASGPTWITAGTLPDAPDMRAAGAAARNEAFGDGQQLGMDGDGHGEDVPRGLGDGAARVRNGM